MPNPRHGNCQACGTGLDATGFCWRCGGEAEEAVVPGSRHKPKEVYFDRCQGRGESGRCQLAASGTHGTAGFCGWHFSLACYGWPKVDYQEFERFMEREQEYTARYGNRNPWRAWKTSDWWEKVNGRDPKGKPIAADERFPDRRCTREENLAGLKACKEVVARAKGPLAKALRGVLEEVPF